MQPSAAAAATDVNRNQKTFSEFINEELVEYSQLDLRVCLFQLFSAFYYRKSEVFIPFPIMLRFSSKRSFFRPLLGKRR